MKRTDFERLILKALSSPRTNLKSTKPHMVLRRPHVKSTKAYVISRKPHVKSARMHEESTRSHVNSRKTNKESTRTNLFSGRISVFLPGAQRAAAAYFAQSRSHLRIFLRCLSDSGVKQYENSLCSSKIRLFVQECQPSG